MAKACDVIWFVFRKLLQIVSSAAWMPTSWWFWLLPLPFCVPLSVLVSPKPKVGRPSVRKYERFCAPASLPGLAKPLIAAFSAAS